MTPLQRMTANQLAMALRDALPEGAFDERSFFAALHAVTDAEPVEDLDAAAG